MHKDALDSMENLLALWADMTFSLLDYSAFKCFDVEEAGKFR